MDDGKIAAALEAAHRAALVVPLTDLATLVVRGKDRVTWLNGLLTCDLAPLRPRATAYGLFVTPKGRIVADVVVCAGEDDLVLVVPRAMRRELSETLEKHLIMEDAELAEGDHAVEQAHGPRAGDVLAAVENGGGRGGVFDPTGLGGAVLLAPAGAETAVYEARDAALAAVGGRTGDDRAWEALRIERRVPRLGVDFDGSTYPQEAGLEKRAVSFSKGCYLGQEVVFMLEKRGHVKRRLVSLAVQATEPPARGAEVKDAQGESVGEVSSAAFVPSAGGLLALAMVKRAKAEAGVELRVGEARATVVAVV